MAPRQTGPRSFGRYQLIVELAKSGLGPLWAARGEGAQRAVAIRRIAKDAALDQTALDRISEAAWAALEVHHDGIAPALDVVMTDNEVGVVTAYAPGDNLRSLLRLANFKRRPFPPRVALRVGLDLLSAIRAATEQTRALAQEIGTVAGGISPDSVVVTSDGRTLLLDVGVAAVMNHTRLFDHIEARAYFSPEQLERSTKLDERSDVFTIGVLLWEMMSGGRRLFVGTSSQAVAERIKGYDVPRLDDSRPVGGEAVPSAVASIVERALARDLGERYRDAAAMTNAIEDIGAAGIASREDVAGVLDRLAGNALRSRARVLDKALESKPTAGAPSVARPSAATQTPSVARPSAATQVPSVAQTPAANPQAAAPAASPTRRAPVEGRRTLLGLAPPKPTGQTSASKSTAEAHHGARPSPGSPKQAQPGAERPKTKHQQRLTPPPKRPSMPETPVAGAAAEARHRVVEDAGGAATLSAPAVYAAATKDSPHPHAGNTRPRRWWLALGSGAGILVLVLVLLALRRSPSHAGGNASEAPAPELARAAAEPGPADTAANAQKATAAAPPEETDAAQAVVGQDAGVADAAADAHPDVGDAAHVDAALEASAPIPKPRPRRVRKARPRRPYIPQGI